MKFQLRPPERHARDTRALFWLVIPQAAPEVCDSLKAIAEDWPGGREKDLSSRDLERLMAWADRWGIRADWVVSAAVFVLDIFIDRPGLDFSNCWRMGPNAIPGGQTLLPDVPSLILDWQPSLPAGDGLPDPGLGRYSEGRLGCRVGGSRGHARRVLHEVLERYFDRVEEKYEADGFIQTDRRDRMGVVEEDRIRWVALRLCRAKSWGKIAKEESARLKAETRLDRNAIRRAVEARIPVLGFCKM